MPIYSADIIPFMTSHASRLHICVGIGISQGNDAIGCWGAESDSRCIGAEWPGGCEKRGSGARSGIKRGRGFGSSMLDHFADGRAPGGESLAGRRGGSLATSDSQGGEKGRWPGALRAHAGFPMGSAPLVPDRRSRRLPWPHDTRSFRRTLHDRRGRGCFGSANVRPLVVQVRPDWSHTWIRVRGRPAH
jgi:hypothetical protein